MAQARQGVPLPESRQRPDWRTGPNVSRGGKLIDVEILGESSIDTSGTVSLSGTTTIASDGWTAPSLQNSWVAYGSTFATPGYRKDSLGVVYIQGLIKSGTVTSGTEIFTLPTGYRPDEDLIVPAWVDGSVLRMTIRSSGRVETYSGWTNGAVSIQAQFYVGV